jgi:hypothetical protein
MRRLKFTLVLISLVALLPAFSFTKQAKESVFVEGVVIEDGTGKPLSGAHVYVVHGEEEALTNGRGEFRIESWQKLPLRVTAELKQYRTAGITVTDPNRKYTIKLKLK